MTTAEILTIRKKVNRMAKTSGRLKEVLELRRTLLRKITELTPEETGEYLDVITKYTPPRTFRRHREKGDGHLTGGNRR